jgi:glycosyltransferase involved in cell wall biosynthesis
MKIVSPMPRGNGAFIVHRYLEQGIPGYRLLDFDPRLALFAPALKLIRTAGADLVHALADFGAMFARADRPLVITFQNYVLDAEMRRHGSLAQSLYYRLQVRPLSRLALQRAAAVTAVSGFTADLVRRDLGYDGPVQIIYNGIDTERFCPSAPLPALSPEERAYDTGAPSGSGIVNVLFSGNLTRRKGVDLLPEILRRTGDNVHLWYTRGLRTRRTLPDHPRLHDLGSVTYDAMPDVYRRADVLLAPTVREGLSLSIAEAMACGLPVVATDCSSLPEMIGEGKGGFLCRQGDAGHFADRISLLARDESLRRAMGAVNRETAVARFDRRRMVAEYTALFGKVLQGVL